MLADGTVGVSWRQFKNLVFISNEITRLWCVCICLFSLGMTVLYVLGHAERLCNLLRPVCQQAHWACQGNRALGMANQSNFGYSQWEANMNNALLLSGESTLCLHAYMCGVINLLHTYLKRAHWRAGLIKKDCRLARMLKLREFK